MALRVLKEAAAAPNGSVPVLSALVQESVQGGPERRRALATQVGVLDNLCDLVRVHVRGFRGDFKKAKGWWAESDPAALVVGSENPAKDIKDWSPDADAHEAAAVAALKLARNLCVGQEPVQLHMWQSGLVQFLVAQAREDLAGTGQERSRAWCDVVPSFLSNLVAGNSWLREEAWSAIQPHGLVAVANLCWARPELAFMLVQNLSVPHEASEGGSEQASTLDVLAGTSDGHVIVLLLLSLLKASADQSDESSSGPSKAEEWASILFHSFWSAGKFPQMYTGLRSLTPHTTHRVLCAAATAPSPDASSSFKTLAGRLCGKVEALGILWHTVKGLLVGEEAPSSAEENTQAVLAALQGHSAETTPSSAVLLLRKLLRDEGFAELLAEELCHALSQLATAFDLDWKVAPLPAAACGSVGLPEGFEVLSLAARAAAEHDAGDAPEAPSASDGEPVSADVYRAAPGHFVDILRAALELAAVPEEKVGVQLPGLLVAAVLHGALQLVAALHRLRFGGAAVGISGSDLPSRTATPAVAIEAATACRLVELLRLCSNVLYGRPRAQEFLRLTGGIPILLSHCYADPELPLLREVGVFAVRNATHHCPENQAIARDLLAERRTAASQHAAAQMARESEEAASSSGQQLETVPELPLMPSPAELGLL